MKNHVTQREASACDYCENMPKRSHDRNEPYAVVVGGVNIDICGQSFAPLIPGDSNPGFTKTSLGGVGRNIAHNLALLGIPVRLLTAMGCDANADLVEDSCNSLGIDISRALKIPGGRTSTYLFLNGPDGDMALAVSDMAVCDSVTPEYLENNRDILQNAAVLILDTNIPEASVRWLAENCTVPVFADPVSVTKAEKLRTCLGRLHTLKPNRLEAEHLSGITIRDRESLDQAAEKLLSTGLKRVFISLGGNGVFYADHQEKGILPVCPAELKNATGAGDAFMAGLAWSYLKGCGIRQAARLASAASSIAVEGEQTINPQMSAEQVEKRAGALP